MPGNDTLLLVVASCIARKLEDLGSKVLEDGSEVNYSMRQKGVGESRRRLAHQVRQHLLAVRSCPA